jgi:hypothetical protein
MSRDTRARGERNNNPGNIRHGQKWQGMAAEQNDPAFITFIKPEWGIRALGKVLLTYQRKYGLCTIDGIINRWAPPAENDTDAYVHHVCQQCGKTADDVLDLETMDDLRTVTVAIIRHELGYQPYGDETIDVGLAWAML